MSVTVVGAEAKKNKKGESFVVLNLASNVVMERSPNTGSWYANVFKANIVASFDLDTARQMIGCKLNGAIIKKECAPYSYTVKSTGKKVTLNYTFQYVETGADVYNEEPVDLDNISGNPLE